jgi:broad specificity phosphatase PhoE
VLVRNAESQGNLAGTVAGWMDTPLSDFGRKQAFLLNQVYEEHAADFTQVHCSDLKRSIDTSFYALAFPSEENFIMQSLKLREMNFGEHEGLHFDNLAESEKVRFSRPDFQAIGGESWTDVQTRATSYFSLLQNKEAHLMFTHGGLIAAYVNHFFEGQMDEMPSNASFVGLHLKSDESGEPESLDFRWDFPHIDDDI